MDKNILADKVGRSLSINKTLNETHEIFEFSNKFYGYTPFTNDTVVNVFKKCDDGQLRKEFHIQVTDINEFIQRNRIKAIYRKNLKMSEGKISAQVAHAVKNLGFTPTDCDIIVLGVSDKKFDELTKENDSYIQYDFGKTEVEAGTPTAAAWFEQK